MKHGRGIYRWPETNLYHDGEWLENRRNGFGVATYPDGGKYEGDFKDNLRSGQGTFWYRDES